MPIVVKHSFQDWRHPRYTDRQAMQFGQAGLRSASNLEKPPTPVTEPAIEEEERRLFFHMQYHPKDIPRREVRKIFADTLEAAIREESGIEQFTIAYSKPTTIGSVIAKAQLHQEEGYEVSKYITGERP